MYLINLRQSNLTVIQSKFLNVLLKYLYSFNVIIFKNFKNNNEKRFFFDDC